MLLLRLSRCSRRPHRRLGCRPPVHCLTVGALADQVLLRILLAVDQSRPSITHSVIGTVGEQRRDLAPLLADAPVGNGGLRAGGAHERSGAAARQERNSLPRISILPPSPSLAQWYALESFGMPWKGRLTHEMGESRTKPMDNATEDSCCRCLTHNAFLRFSLLILFAFP